MSLSSRSSSSSGGGGRPPEPTSYFAVPHRVEGDNFGGQDLGTGRRMGSVSVQNGALNMHIPCAFSYAYDVPVPPQPRPKASHRRPQTQEFPRSGNKYPIRVSKSSSVPKECRPFLSTVKSGQLYKAKPVPSSGQSSRTQNKTSVVWDFHAGERVPFQAVDYGRELYEQAAQNLARSLREQKIAEKDTPPVDGDVEDNCFDFSRPGINSSRKTTKALEKAMESLKTLPNEVEDLLRKDKRFEPLVMSKATKSLNVPKNSTVYKDLIPVDPSPDVRTEAESNILAEIAKSMTSVRKPSKAKDPEPNLEDFQTNSYTRIRPQSVPAPPKPSTSIGVDSAHEFEAVENEKRTEDESNRL